MVDSERPMRLYVDGIFDITHYGHMRLFKQCKEKFTNVYLIVGVAGDKDCATHKYKCVMNQYERSESLRHVRWVDEVICPCPWSIDQEFLDQHRIDFVCHDDAPYTYGPSEGDLYAYVKSIGKFLPTTRTEEVETTDMIKKVLLEADYYADKVMAAEAPVPEEDKEVIRKAGRELKSILSQVLS